MKLIEKEGWYARVYVEAKIKKDFTDQVLEEGFPFDIGAVTLKSKDGTRDFVLDSYHTEYCNDKEKAGETYTFHSRLEIDLELFGEDYNHELTVEDLKDCTGEFYCANDSDFFETPEISCVFFIDEEQVVVKCEEE